MFTQPGRWFVRGRFKVRTGSSGKMSDPGFMVRNRWLGEDVGPWVYGSKQVVRGECHTPGFYGLKQVVGSWFSSARGATSRWAFGPSDTTFRFLCRSGCPMAVTATAASCSFLMCRGRQIAGPDPRLLPTVVPGRVRPDQRRYRCAAGPRAAVCGGTRRRDGTHREVAEPHRGVSDRSGLVPRILPGIPGPGRRHHGSLVAIATGSPTSGRVGMVNTANALHDLPVVKDAPGLREYLGVACVSRSWPTPPRSMTSPANRPRSSVWPVDRRAGGAPGTAGRR